MNPTTTATTINSTGQYHLVIFRLDRQVYGLTIDQVVQIIPMVKITPLPQMDQLVEGVINMRGKVAPVVNVRRSLGLDTTSLQLYTPIILAQLRGHLTGLIVDEVLDVQSFSADQVVPTSEIVPDWLDSSPVLEGLVYLDGLTILLINPEYLLQPVQIQSLLSAIPQNGERKRPGNGQRQPAPAASGLTEQPAPATQPAAPMASTPPDVILPVTSTLAYGSPVANPVLPPMPPPPAIQPAAAVNRPAASAPQKNTRGRSKRSQAEDRMQQQFNALGIDLPPADL